MTPTRTPFAGLERLAPGDPLSSDGYAFQNLNPALIDRLLRVGAVTHRHDAHAALADPSTAPTVSTTASGGSIPAAQSIYVTYTLLDADDGETLPVAAVMVTTPDGFVDPVSAPSGTVDLTAGTLLAGDYSYALTVTDGLGGETAIGPALGITVPPGYANAEVHLSGLAAILAACAGTSTTASWRLWRARGGGQWYLIGSDTIDTFTDNGVAGDCSVDPPASNTTVGANTLSVTVPGGQPADAARFRVYGSLDGSFVSPALLGDYPIADVTVAKVFTDLEAAVSLGTPPSSSTAFGGANQIDPDTDLLNYPWKRPVANAAALPALGNADGDMREALDTHTLYVWDDGSSTWVAGGGAVGTRGSLWYSGSGAPGAIGGELDNDLYVDETNGDYYELVSGVWTLQGNLKGPAGTNGTNGTNGARGSLWYTGHGAPGAIGGELDDDMYLDVDTNDYYQRIGGSWTLEGTIGGGGSAPAPERAHLAAGASTTATGYQKVPIDTADFGANWDLANSRYTVPANGKYRVFAQAMVQGSDNLSCLVYKNGVQAVNGGSGQPGGGYAGQTLADIIDCAAGDHLELWVYAPSARALVHDGTANFLTIEPI